MRLIRAESLRSTHELIYGSDIFRSSLGVLLPTVNAGATWNKNTRIPTVHTHQQATTERDPASNALAGGRFLCAKYTQQCARVSGGFVTVDILSGKGCHRFKEGRFTIKKSMNEVMIKVASRM